MKHPLLLLARLALVAGCVTSAEAARPLKSLSVSDLGLGLPKEEAKFEPGWSVSAGTLILQRSSNASMVLCETPPPDSAGLLSTSDLGFGFESGPILTLTREISEVTSAELVYFGVNGWGGDKAVTLPGGVTTSRFDVGSTLLDQVGMSYHSEIETIELNAQRSLSARLQWLIGFRWTGLDESSQVLWDGRLTGVDYSSIFTDVNNDLYGMQFGLLGTLWQPSACVRLDGHLKAGVFGNHISMNREVDGTFATISSESRSVDRTSFLGECGLHGTVDLTQRIAISAGYQVLWLDGVANGFSPLGGRSSDSVLYHGLGLLISASW